MKKIALSLILSFVFCVGAFGASSDDIYLRQDVFEAKIEALYNRLHGEIQILSQKIDGNFRTLDSRINDLHGFFYLIIFLISVVIAIPFVQKLFELQKEKQEKITQSLPFTLDDVKK